MIKAIIFDMGGVLLDLELQRCRKTFVEDLGYEKIDELLDPCHQKGIYALIEEGMMSADEYRRLILQDSKEGKTPADVDAAMWSLLGNVMPYKVDYVKGLAQKYPLFLLSNNNEISWARCNEIFIEAGLPPKEVFQKLLLSYEMKLLKPGQEIYLKAIEETGYKAEEMLFIDDSINNVEAAQNAGLHALHYVPGEDLVEAINKKLEELC